MYYFHTYIVSKMLYSIWKAFTIGNKLLCNWITFLFHPTIVDNYIFVASIFITVRNDMISSIFKKSFTVGSQYSNLEKNICQNIDLHILHLQSESLFFHCQTDGSNGNKDNDDTLKKHLSILILPDAFVWVCVTIYYTSQSSK